MTVTRIGPPPRSLAQRLDQALARDRLVRDDEDVALVSADLFALVRLDAPFGRR